MEARKTKKLISRLLLLVNSFEQEQQLKKKLKRENIGAGVNTCLREQEYH